MRQHRGLLVHQGRTGKALVQVTELGVKKPSTPIRAQDPYPQILSGQYPVDHAHSALHSHIEQTSSAHVCHPNITG